MRGPRGAAGPAAMAAAAGWAALGLAGACVLPTYEVAGTSASTETTAGAAGSGAASTDTSSQGAAGGVGGATSGGGGAGGPQGGSGGSGGCPQCTDEVHVFPGTSLSRCLALLPESTGDLVLGGSFDGTLTFAPLGPLMTSAGTDGFLARVDAAGDGKNRYGYGGGATQVVTSVARLPDGTLIVGGSFEGTLQLPGGPILQSAGKTDGFVANLQPGGGSTWSKQIGGADSDLVTGVAVTPDGFVMVTGMYVGSATLPKGSASSHGGGTDVFLLKLSGGGVPVWQTTFGGKGDDEALGLATDSEGGVTVVGHHPDQMTFDGGLTLPDSSGTLDAYVVRFDTVGAITWSHRLSGPANQSNGEQLARSIAIDGADTAYVLADYDQPTQIDGAGTTYSGAAPRSLLVMKLDAKGGTVAWAQPIPGVDVKPPLSVAAAPGDGGFAIAGGFAGTASFGGATVMSGDSGVSTDAFVARFGADGLFLWQRLVTGTGTANAGAVAFDSGGLPSLCGASTGEADFGSGLVKSTAPGDWELYLLRYDKP